MPIRINLLAEAQAADEARRRDPVKRAMMASAALIVLMLGWGMIELSKAMMASSGYTKEEDRWKSIAAEFGMVKTNNMRAGVLEKKINALTDYSTNRFLWGSALNALQNCLNAPNPLVDQIQIIRINGSQNYAQIEGVPAKKGPDGRLMAGTGKPAQSIEKIVLTIEGKDYGNQNDQNYLRLRTNLWNVPFLKEKLGSIEAIQLKTFNPQQVPDDRGLYSTFVLECKFPEKRRDER